MSLTDNPLLTGYMSFGQFDLFGSSSFLKRKRVIINRLIKLLIFFNTSKFIVILLGKWFGLDLKATLIDFYLFNDNQQKLVDLGIAFVHLGFCVSFYFWSSLNEKTSPLKSFRFLLYHTKDRHRYRQFYALDRASTDKFLTVYRLTCLLVQPLVAVYSFLILGAILRCLYESFYRVSLLYFLTAGLLLSLTTAFSYFLLVLFTVTKSILVLLSTEFFKMRVKAINIHRYPVDSEHNPPPSASL